MMNIVSLLAQCGAKYTRHAYACDYFVSYNLIDKNGNPYKCYRLDKAQIINDTERSIEFISINELLEILGTTEAKIASLDRSRLAPIKRRDNKSPKYRKKVGNI
mgnify:CR=1 FL=1